MDGIYNTYRSVFGNFQPYIYTVDMTVYFETIMVINDCDLETAVVQNAPTVLIGGQPNELYTLVMFRTVAADPDEPHLRQVVSWIVTNIPGGGTAEQGTEIASYVGPNPEIGRPSYAFHLYKQQSQIDDMDPLTSRRFDLAGFANKHNLGRNVGLAFFNVRNQAN